VPSVLPCIPTLAGWLAGQTYSYAPRKRQASTAADGELQPSEEVSTRSAVAAALL